MRMCASSSLEIIDACRTFTCGNPLQRLREIHDETQRKGEKLNIMRTVRVTYTVTRTKDDGKTVPMNKERILSELDSIDPDHIQKILEKEMQATEEPSSGKTVAGYSLVVTNITELHPTGDDDQM